MNLLAPVLALAVALGGPATSSSPGDPPPADRSAIRHALAQLPSPTVVAGQARVEGRGAGFEARGGVRDLRTRRPVPRDTRFRVASVTKAFTAVVVLRLAAERRLDLDRPVQHYLPRLLPASYPPIPVRTLLDHTSGLPASTEDAGSTDPAYAAAHRRDYYSPEQVVASAVAHPMRFAPGTAQEYTGVNYFVLGLLVERVSGRPFGAELRRDVLRPLGLHETSLPRPDDVTLPGPHAHAYLRLGDRLVDVTEQSPYGWAESGLVPTTADLQRFLRAVLAGDLLPPAEQRRLFTVPDVPYLGGGDCGDRACFSQGLTRTTLPGGTVVWGKSGGTLGTSSGMFGTRDGHRLLTYVLLPTGNRDGSEGPVLQAVVAGAFGVSTHR